MVRFIKVNELQLIQVDLLYFFHFTYVAANASELFCMAQLAIFKRVLHHSNLSF